jgi:hypothetical protein
MAMNKEKVSKERERRSWGRSVGRYGGKGMSEGWMIKFVEMLMA